MAPNSLQDRFLLSVENLKLKFPVAEIAEKTGYGQPIVSTYLKGKQAVSMKFLKSFCEAFKIDIEEIKTGSGSKAASRSEPSAMEILSVLAEAFKSQTEILKAIQKEMAREDTQAKIEEKVKAVQDRTKEMESNLIRTVVGVERIAIVQDRDQIQLLQHFAKLESGKNPPSPHESKKLHQIDGDGSKKGKKNE